MTDPKRPLLPTAERARLRKLQTKAQWHAEHEGSSSRAYAKAVSDTLAWLNGEDMSPMLREITR